MRAKPQHSRERFDRSQRPNHRVASTGGLLEFRVESLSERWSRKSVEFARRSYARISSISTGSQLLITGLIIAIVLAVFAFLPRLHLLVWPGTAWALLVVSVIVVLGVIVDILFAMISMYLGYRPTDTRLPSPSVLAQADANPSGGRPSLATGPARRRADVLDQLRVAERSLSQLQDRPAFRSLTDSQKKQHYWALAELRALIAEIANEIPQRKVAS